MNNRNALLGIWLVIFFLNAPRVSIGAESAKLNSQGAGAPQVTKKLIYNGITVDAVIKKPESTTVDVMLTYHGTVGSDKLILSAASNTLDYFDALYVNDTALMYVSVAYPEENLLFGDNILQAEAALLWVQHKAEQELGIKIGKVLLAGHSQGGYLVTRLNTMHETDGVVASAPGPLNLVFRCQLEEDGKLEASRTCKALERQYGTTDINPQAYRDRSLLGFTRGYKADILFFQGMADSSIQLASWPSFKKNIDSCSDCKHVQYIELPGLPHEALFMSEKAKKDFNAFIDQKRR